MAPEIFFDTSALFSGIISSRGAARVLLILAQMQRIRISISLQVTVEMERALSRKAPEAISRYRQILDDAHIQVHPDPDPGEVRAREGLISHKEDLPILTAAVLCQTDFLVTHNRLHFIEDPSVAEKSGLRIGSPGDALAWVRGKLKETG